MAMKDSAAVTSMRRMHRARLIPLWALLLGALVMALIGASPHIAGTDSYVVGLIGKFLCFAIFALSIDLIWGFTGILSLGQAVYFGIGAYFVAFDEAQLHARERGTATIFPISWNGMASLKCPDSWCR
jgi:ABC-type branched-subunit amino acid transport system permease subunit